MFRRFFLSEICRFLKLEIKKLTFEHFSIGLHILYNLHPPLKQLPSVLDCLLTLYVLKSFLFSIIPIFSIYLTKTTKFQPTKVGFRILLLKNTKPYLLLNLSQSGDMSEISFVMAGNPLGRLQVTDLPTNQVGEHAHRCARLIMFLKQFKIKF